MASSWSHFVIGYSSAFGKMLAATSSASCTQALQGAIPDFQLSVVRSLVQFVIYIIGGKIFGEDFKIKRESFPGLLYFGFAFLVFNVGYYSATVYLPLTEAFGVLIITTIVTVFLHSRLVLYIDITKSHIISLLVCVLGIILVAQPSWLFNRLATTFEVMPSAFDNISNSPYPMNISSEYVNEFSEGQVLWGYILSVIGGVSNGLKFNINGIILKDVKPIVKITYAATFCMIGSVVFMFYMEDPVLRMDLTQFILVLGHGVLSAATGFLFVMSAHYIPGATLSAVYSFDMVIMLVFQYTVMHSIQPGNYNWIEVLGCIVIIIGAGMTPLVGILAHRAKSNELP